jgi:hypothetical protein
MSTRLLKISLSWAYWEMMRKVLATKISYITEISCAIKRKRCIVSHLRHTCQHNLIRCSAGQPSHLFLSGALQIHPLSLIQFFPCVLLNHQIVEKLMTHKMTEGFKKFYFHHLTLWRLLDFIIPWTDILSSRTKTKDLDF